jgi:hypothetical protein
MHSISSNSIVTYLNELEQVETGGKDDKPVDVLLHNKSVVDTSAASNDTTRSRHMLGCWYYVRIGVEVKMHLLTWMSNIAQVADMMANILPWKGLISKLIYSPTKIDRD